MPYVTEELILPEYCKKKLRSKKALLIIAPSDFNDEEYFTVKEILEYCHVKVSTASNVKVATGLLGNEVETDLLIDKVKVEDYDVLVYIGGTGVNIFFNDPIILAMTKKAFDNGLIAAAICFGPCVLASSGVLKGKQATVFSSETKKLIDAGVNIVDLSVVRDGNIITARNPVDSKAFAIAILQVLGE